MRAVVVVAAAWISVVILELMHACTGAVFMRYRTRFYMIMWRFMTTYKYLQLVESCSLADNCLIHVSDLSASDGRVLVYRGKNV